MRIVVNHVTRMEAPRICVAGFEPRAMEHVRPTTSRLDPITRELLREEGGPFGMGAVVELGRVSSQPTPPEIEDCRFRTANARHVEDLEGDDFLGLLDEMSSPSLIDGFGLALKRVGDWKYATERGRGKRSLAVISPVEQPWLEVDRRFGKLQLRFNDVEPQTYVPVNDVRFYEADQQTVKAKAVADARRRLRRGVDVYLMFGLTRPYEAPHDDRERHWLQLNGLCLADRPVGDAP